MLNRRTLVLLLLVALGGAWWFRGPLGVRREFSPPATPASSTVTVPAHTSTNRPDPAVREPGPTPIAASSRPAPPVPIFSEGHPALLEGRRPRLSAAFIQAYGLAEGEAQAIQRTLQAAFAALEQRALENASVERPAADTLLVHVRPFDGAVVYDELLNGIQAALGPARYRSFLSHYGVDVDVLFYSFGAERREIELRRRSAGGLILTQTRVSKEAEIDGDPVDYATVDDLRPALGRLVTLIPPGF
jgi:hypothetical protein